MGGVLHGVLACVGDIYISMAVADGACLGSGT